MKPKIPLKKKINGMGWVFSILILLLLFALVMFLKQPTHLLINGKKADGVVVAMASSEEVVAPVVQFTTANGETLKITSHTYTQSPSISIGDAVTVAYDPTAPQDGQLLMFRELTIVWFIIGFIVFIFLLWISALLIDPEGGFDDPFQFLPTMVVNLKLSPLRFPMYFLLPIVIFCCGLASWVTITNAIDRQTIGIKVSGYVTGSVITTTTLHDRSKASGEFAVIKYTDMNGGEHTINRALAMPLSRLKTGDEVEVIYLAKRPDLGVVNSWDEFYMAPLIFTLFFLAFLSLLVLIRLGKIR